MTSRTWLGRATSALAAILLAGAVASASTEPAAALTVGPPSSGAFAVGSTPAGVHDRTSGVRAPEQVATAKPRFDWPLSGPPHVLRRFDPPPRPWLPGHRGVDLAGTAGVAVHAAGPGRVAFAGSVAGVGVVSIDHAGGLRTTYEPVAATVRVGQSLATGDVIGTLLPGHAGCPVAACLHWGLRRGEVYLDPLSLLGFGRVRLLSLDAASSARGE